MTKNENTDDGRNEIKETDNGDKPGDGKVEGEVAPVEDSDEF